MTEHHDDLSKETPSTSAAVSISARAAVGSRSGNAHRAVVVLPRDGLGYAAIESPMCPACGSREARHPESFSLRWPGAFERAFEAVFSPAVAVTAAAALWAMGSQLTQLAGTLLFFFGPAAAIGTAGTTHSWGRRPARIKIGLCSTCRGDLRNGERKEALLRRVKVFCAGATALMGAGLHLNDHPMSAFRLLAVMVIVTGFGSAIASLAEARQRRALAAKVPRPVGRDHVGLRLELPAAWGDALAGRQALEREAGMRGEESAAK